MGQSHFSDLSLGPRRSCFAQCVRNPHENHCFGAKVCFTHSPEVASPLPPGSFWTGLGAPVFNEISYARAGASRGSPWNAPGTALGAKVTQMPPKGIVLEGLRHRFR